MALIVNAKKSLSSYQLARDLDLNQKSAWYMQQRIRAAMAAEQAPLLQGIVEADEAYIGGKPRKRNKRSDDGPGAPRGRATRKLPVIGAVERGGNVTARVADDLSGKGILRFIKDTIDPAGTLLITDEYRGYNAVRGHVRHAVINHSVAYADGATHTNTIEGFWSLLKRGVVRVAPSLQPPLLAVVHRRGELEVQPPQRQRRLRFVPAGMLRMTAPNALWYGDCLTIMRDHMNLGSVDLIYLDPPFNSQREYNAIYKDETGRPLPDQIEAFCDLWELDEERERALRTMPVLMREAGVDDEAVEFWRLWMNALRKTQPRLLAYLSYMVERLLVMKRLLHPTGSVYLHCDPTASHYIKIMMDAIFGHRNFQNEIVWKRTGSHGGAKRWGPIHDVILFYAKGENHKWNKVYQDYSPDYLTNHYKSEDARGRYQLVSLTGAGTRDGDSGRPWRGVDPTRTGRHWAVPRTALETAFPDRTDLASHDNAGKADPA